MKSAYYFDYNFEFLNNELLVHRLCNFLDTAITSQLEKHEYPAGNYSVKVGFYNVHNLGGCVLAGDDAFITCVYDSAAADRMIVKMYVSIKLDKTPAATYDGKVFYSLDFENDADSISFVISDCRVALSDKEMDNRARLMREAFISSFSLPCRVNVANFPHVTFNIKFSCQYDPPDSDYVRLLLGYGGVLKISDDPYTVIIKIDFGDSLPFVLRDAVKNLTPLKQKISMILIK